MGPATRYTLRRNTANIIKDLIWLELFDFFLQIITYIMEYHTIKLQRWQWRTRKTSMENTENESWVFFHATQTAGS